MARSPAHRFGQIIGDAVEAGVERELRSFATQHGLYLDRKGPRPARGRRRKVSWTDEFGNSHDLDFVLERGGSSDRIGVPVAFIESAWRTYTKHSRNKAQEIQGAVLPLQVRYHRAAPFIGAVLAGEFTQGAVNQLRSQGFTVLHLPYTAVASAFETVGIDALFGQDTSDAEVAQKIDIWNQLPPTDQEAASRAILDDSRAEVASFFEVLRRAIERQVKCVRVCPLHGSPTESASVDAAMNFIRDYNESQAPTCFVKYEILLTYDNGNRVSAELSDRNEALEFLKAYLRPDLTPTT